MRAVRSAKKRNSLARGGQASPGNVRPASTIIVGLGNPILGDDGVGWKVAEYIQPEAERRGFVVEFLAEGGLGLAERVIGYDRLVIIDAQFTGQYPIGTLMSLKLEDLPQRSVGHLSSAHETDLRTALQLIRSLGEAVPREVYIVAIESPHVYDFSEDLSPEIKSVVPQAGDLVFRLLNEMEKLTR